MVSVNDILEDDYPSQTEKLRKVNELLDSKVDQENINAEIIFNINTDDAELKLNVLKKIFRIASNFNENIEYFLKFFKKAFSDLENCNLLANFIIFLFEIRKNRNEISNILNQLGIENINKVLLNNAFPQRDCSESNRVFKIYLNYLSVDQQSIFLKYLFEFSKINESIKWFYLTLDIIDDSTFVHDCSVVRTKEFWIYLTDGLVNSKDEQETQTFLSVLHLFINLVKNTKVALTFLTIDGDEAAWNAFYVLMQVFTSEKQELIKPSLQLLPKITILHYFWKHCAFKLLLKHAPIHLKCAVIVNILKQNIEADYLQSYFKMIFPAINERRCINEECPVFTQLKCLCENLDVENFKLLLDGILNIPWNNQFVWKIFGTVLVDSKKNLVDMVYFSRILKFIGAYNFFASPLLEMKQISSFFCDPDNFDFWWELKGSIIPFYTDHLPKSKNLKDMALPKLLELSIKNSDCLRELEIYIDFLKENDFYVDMIENYPVSIHVRLVVYRKLFTMSGYSCAETKLDRERTVNDFYEYLVNHLNKNTFMVYKEMIVSFLDLMGRYMGFTYPEKACAEFLKIIRNPELYTKYQICCTADALRYTNYRFDDLSGSDRDKEYYKIAQKWKHFIVETEDLDICKEGLYFVLEKGQLDAEEYNNLVKRLIEKHYCDCVTEEIYSRYLKNDLVNFSFKHLLDIIEKYPSNCNKFVKFFCDIIFSKNYMSCDEFSLENEYVKFCFADVKSLEYSIDGIYDAISFLNPHDSTREFEQRIVNSVLAIYLNRNCNSCTKVTCLSTLKTLMSHNLAPVFKSIYKADLQLILDSFKEMYAANLKNDIIKLRIVQGLFLLVPFAVRNVDELEEIKNYFKRIVVDILVEESNCKTKAVKQISQFMYILLLENEITFKEIKSIIEKIKEQPNMSNSFISVLYHVMPFCEFPTNEIDDIIASIVPFWIKYDVKLRLYAQILLQRMNVLFNDIKYKDIWEKYDVTLKQINLDIENKKEEIFEILGTDYVFLKDLSPLRDNSVETVLYILPKLNQVKATEWKDNMANQCSTYRMENINKNKDKNETFNGAVNLYLDTNGKDTNYSAQDVLEILKWPKND